MNSNNIIILSDIYEMRAAKEKELAYYTERLKELQEKMFESPPDDTWIKGRLNPTWNFKRKKHDKKE